MRMKKRMPVWVKRRRDPWQWQEIKLPFLPKRKAQLQLTSPIVYTTTTKLTFGTSRERRVSPLTKGLWVKRWQFSSHMTLILSSHMPISTHKNPFLTYCIWYLCVYGVSIWINSNKSRQVMYNIVIIIYCFDPYKYFCDTLQQ